MEATNKDYVTRAEFERLLLTCQSMAEHNVKTCDLMAGLNERIKNQETELAASRRLLDGVKDAVCDWAKKLDSFGFIGGKPNLDAYGSVCRIIAAAQQPAPSAEGAPVTIDPAASAAADTNADATEKART